MPTATLADRAFLRIGGADAEHFLQNLVTTDLAQMPVGEAWPGALLTPQGKILFDFLVSRDGDNFLVETTGDQLDGLSKRLTMYKLRAQATYFRRNTRDLIVFSSATFSLENIAAARAQGVELGLWMQPVQGFTLQAYTSPDSAETRRAFVEKREAKF